MTRVERMGSPCIGVCSTTYGDLICRGCYRFAHEVSEWNGYEGAQRMAVQERLDALRSGAVARHLSPERIALLVNAAKSVKLSRTDGIAPPVIAYEVLRRLVVWRRPLPGPAPVRGKAGAAAGAASDVEEGPVLLGRIDREMFDRSCAHYERSFRAPPT